MLFIGVCSAVDAYLNIIYPVHYLVEENPLARGLLLASDNNLAFLVAVKGVGTFVAMTFLVGYYYYSVSRAYLVAAVVSLFYIFFLIYMVIP